MKNKVLVELYVPTIDRQYDVFIPVNSKVGHVIGLLLKSIQDMESIKLDNEKNMFLYDTINGQKYDVNLLVKNTNIRNGSKIVFA